MEIIRDKKNDIEIIRLSGNLALAGVKEAKSNIKPIIEDPSVKKIIINMKGVKLLDSSGIGFLVASTKAAQKREANLALCNCSDDIMDIFKSTHLDNYLNLYDNEENAVSNI